MIKRTGNRTSLVSAPVIVMTIVMFLLRCYQRSELSECSVKYPAKLPEVWSKVLRMRS